MIAPFCRSPPDPPKGWKGTGGEGAPAEGISLHHPKQWNSSDSPRSVRGAVWECLVGHSPSWSSLLRQFSFQSPTPWASVGSLVQGANSSPRPVDPPRWERADP